MVGINGATAPDQEHEYNLDTGKFDVRVTTGASFTTQRQEAAALYQDTLKILPPEAAMNVLDLVFKYQDSPGAEAMALRLKKMVNPELLDEKEREQDGVNPQVQQLSAQLQQLAAEAQAKIQALEAELQSKAADAQVKMAEVQIKAQEIEIKKGELQLKLIQANKPESMADDSFDKELKAKELEIKAFDAETKRIAATQKSQESQMGIKLDTNGFQIMKTPEQLQLEEQELLLKAQSEQAKQQQEAEELQAKAIQTQMVIDALGGISAQLGQLNVAVSQPITMIRDEAGNLIGAS
jgi:hypothetical protein